MKLASLILSVALTFSASLGNAQSSLEDLGGLFGKGSPLAGILGGSSAGQPASPLGGLEGLGPLLGQGGLARDPQEMLRLLKMVYKTGISTGMFQSGPYAERDLSADDAITEAEQCLKPFAFDIPYDMLLGFVVPNAAASGVSGYREVAEVLEMVKEVTPADPCTLRFLVLLDSLIAGLQGEFARATTTYERLRESFALKQGSNLKFMLEMVHASMLSLQLRNDEARLAFEALEKEAQLQAPDATTALIVKGALASMDFLEAYHRKLGIDDPYVGRPDLDPSLSTKLTDDTGPTFEDGFARLGSVEDWQNVPSQLAEFSCIQLGAILGGAIQAGDLDRGRKAAEAALGQGTYCASVLDDDNYFSSRIFFGRGRLALHERDLDAARIDLEKALNLALKHRSAGSNHVRDIQIALTEAAALDGRTDDAVAHAKAALEGLVDWLGPEIKGAATRDHRRLVAAYVRQVTSLAYQVALHAPSHSGAQRLAADASLRFKGLQGEEDAALERIARLAEPGSKVEDLAIRISDMRRQLAAVRLAESEAVSPKRQEMERQLDELELELGGFDNTFKAGLVVRGAGLDAVEGQLKAGDVLVEYQAFDAKPLGALTAGRVGIEYAASVVTPGAVRVVRLGREPELRSLSVNVNEIPLRRERLSDWQAKLETELLGFGKIVLTPLELGAPKQLIISPDGLLSGAPFRAMFLDDGRRLSEVEGQTVYVVHSGRALLAPRSDAASGIVAVGGVPTKVPEKFLGASLEEALNAIDAVKERFGERAELLTGAAATKSNLLASVNAPRVFHIATHAGYGVEIDDQAYDWRRLELSIEMDTETYSDADARITALEIQAMNLEGTDLVVLSACDSAVGTLEMGEGLHSLARAFRIAGAEAVIATRRVVVDTEAAAFFAAFYEEWQGQEAAAEVAFEAALNRMWRERPDGDWSAFAIVRNNLG